MNDPRQQQRQPGLIEQVTRVVGSRSIDTQAHRTAAPTEVVDPADTRSQSHVGTRAVGYAGAGLGQAGDLAVVEVDAVGQPDVLAFPFVLGHVREWAGAEHLHRVLVLGNGLAAMGVQTDPEGTTQPGRLSVMLARAPKDRARREGHLRHRPRPPLMEPVVQSLTIGQDHIEVLAGPVGHDVAGQIHRAPATDVADAHGRRRIESRIEHLGAAISGKQVVVVTGQGATAEHQLGTGHLGGHIQVVGIEMPPQRHVPGQPRQERQTGDGLKGPRQVLEHVMVGVDETRQRDSAPGIHHRGLGNARGRPGSEGANHAVFGEQPRVPEDTAIRIHGDQITDVLEEGSGYWVHGCRFNIGGLRFRGRRGRIRPKRWRQGRV